MEVVLFSDLETLAAGLGALGLGTVLCRKFRFLERLDLPTSVVGGMLVAGVVAAIRTYGGVEIHFASKISDIFLLAFFTTIGLSARISSLKAGGKPLVILCGVTILLIVVQNIAGILIALSFGAHAYYGLLIGSISLVGGPGTAAAWAKEAQAAGLTYAPEVGLAGATIAVIAGALVAGPITGRLVSRLAAPDSGRSAERTDAPWIGPKAGTPANSAGPAQSVEQAMRSLFLFVIAVLIGDKLNDWASTAGMVLPGFLTAMLGGAMITNVADAIGAKLDFGPIEKNGQIALQSFLSIYLMSLKIWTIGALIVPLAVNVGVQIVLTTAVAVLVLFRLLGRDYDAALTAGGFLGFGLSSMAVGMATMGKIAGKHGPSPKAFLLITLAGSFFVDLANALIIQLFLALPWLQPGVP